MEETNILCPNCKSSYPMILGLIQRRRFGLASYQSNEVLTNCRVLYCSRCKHMEHQGADGYSGGRLHLGTWVFRARSTGRVRIIKDFKPSLTRGLVGEGL